MTIWKYIKAFLFGCHCQNKSAKGTLILGYGRHEVALELDGTPVRVHFSMSLPKDDSVSVCGCTDVNKVGVNVKPDGFLVYADIRTTVCTIEWACDF